MDFNLSYNVYAQTEIKLNVDAASCVVHFSSSLFMQLMLTGKTFYKHFHNFFFNI